jgi:hypothetical protein
MILKLPLTDDFAQTFTCTLGNVGTFNFRVVWNDRAQIWGMDITDAVSNVVIINGLTLVCGVDLLAPYGLHASFGTLVVIDGLVTGLDPSMSWLTNGFYVVWLSPSELST